MTEVCVSSATVVSSLPAASSTPTAPSEESCYINLLAARSLHKKFYDKIYKLSQIKVQKNNREIFR